MNATINTTATTTTTAALSIPVFIDAAYNHGIVTVSIYNTAERTESEVCNFSNAANALNYAFLLKKRHGLIIARRAMELIKWVVERTGAISTRAAARKAALLKTDAPSIKSSVVAEWEAMKSKNPDAVLLMRSGDAYTALNADAEEVAAILNLSAVAHADENGAAVNVLSFGADEIDTHLPKLIKAGLRVAVSEEPQPLKVEKPKKKSKKAAAA